MELIVLGCGFVLIKGQRTPRLNVLQNRGSPAGPEYRQRVNLSILAHPNVQLPETSQLINTGFVGGDDRNLGIGTGAVSRANEVGYTRTLTKPRDKSIDDAVQI